MMRPPRCWSFAKAPHEGFVIPPALSADCCHQCQELRRRPWFAKIQGPAFKLRRPCRARGVPQELRRASNGLGATFPAPPGSNRFRMPAGSLSGLKSVSLPPGGSAVALQSSLLASLGSGSSILFAGVNQSLRGSWDRRHDISQLIMMRDEFCAGLGASCGRSQSSWSLEAFGATYGGWDAFPCRPEYLRQRSFSEVSMVWTWSQRSPTCRPQVVFHAGRTGRCSAKQCRHSHKQGQ
ncbi:hypothetical protein LXA43DRAFT_157758 [Ganoderma leucocontextum]|nr:hypothetical protein LXA43DRAFT_157758 [Ganoderma leucocontextum]